ncbi:MAG: efflux RND transporter periplasmic adaptor subunit [Nitrospirae bacterium]|nr:efflux RND transporter periplasmic adaptor subunit [Nitrospirota bacterium]
MNPGGRGRVVLAAALVAALGVGIGLGLFLGRQTGPAGEAKKEGDRKVLFYRHPMDPSITSDKPMKDSMGMDYIPVYEGGEKEGKQEAAPGFDLSPEKIQKLGVRTEEVKTRAISQTFRTVGKIEYDERKLFDVQSKVAGWIEKLHVNTTGQAVRKGEPLLEIYSPDLVSTQREYLLALENREKLRASPFPEVRAAGETTLDAARQRFKFWGISDEEIARLEESRAPSRTMILRSPVSGVVVEKPALQGMAVMPGQALFKVADTSTVWLHADAYEYEIPHVRVGQRAHMELAGFPGEKFWGTVVFVYPFLQTETRTTKVRIEFPNPAGRLKPGMYAMVEIHVHHEGPRPSVPESAVLDSGKRQIVFVDHGDGRFEAREVTTGYRGDGYVQILKGVKEGEKVVTAANFLLDAESSIRGALQRIGESVNR